MVSEIQRAKQIGSYRVDFSFSPPHFVNKKTISSLTSCQRGLGDQIKAPFIWIQNIIKWLLSKIFPCWCSQINKKKTLRPILEKVQHLKAKFGEKLKTLKTDEFKSWWQMKFNALDPQVKKLFFQEYANRQGYQNFSESDLQELARAFIVELGDERINQKTVSPIEEMPNYFIAVERALLPVTATLSSQKKIF